MGERLFYTQNVTGSIPVSPTNNMISKKLQMKKLFIFGDSFADSTLNTYTKFQQDTSWYEFLSSDYEIINYGTSGTGPHYSFKEYYDFIQQFNRHEYEDYIVLFFLSGEDRIHFPNTNPRETTSINWDFQKKESWFYENNYVEKVKIYYDAFKSEIDFFYLTMHDEMSWSNMKNVGFLHMLSLLLNMKTIVFFTYGIKILNNTWFKDYISRLYSSNFYVSPIELAIVAEEEFKDKDNYNTIDFQDERRNHLSQQNHKVLYENIKKIIVNDYKNLIPFVKDIDESKNLGKRVHTRRTGDFIYK